MNYLVSLGFLGNVGALSKQFRKNADYPRVETL